MAKKVVKEEIKEEVKKEEKVVAKEPAKKVSSEKFGAIVALVIGFVVVCACIFLLAKFVFLKPSLESNLNTSLKNMGESFYTEFYYTEISKNKSKSEVSEFLEKFKDVGIKINLDNLERYNDGKNKEEIAKFKNEKGKACNKTTTQAVIYPKSPYGKTDYRVEANLDCGFSSEK